MKQIAAVETNVSNASPPWRALTAIFLMALVIRGGVLWWRFDSLQADPDGYRAIAVQLRVSGQFARSEDAGPPLPTAFRPPLYPCLLALCGGDDAIPSGPIAVLHALLGAATAAGVYHLAYRLGLRRGAWAAALLTICDPLLLHQSCLVMTETLAAALALAAVIALTAWSHVPSLRNALIAGVWLGLCVLCRPTFLVWLGIVAMIAIALPAWVSSTSSRRPAFAILLAAALLLMPWTLRNWLILGRPIATTTHGGYTMLLGNNPDFYRFVAAGDWTTAWQFDEFDHQWQQRRRAALESVPADSPQRELAVDTAAYDWAKESITAQPQLFVLAGVYRWRQFLVPLPNCVDAQESRGKLLARYAVAAWYVVLYVFIAIGLPWWRTSAAQPAAVWSVTLLLAFFALHTIYWTDLRMRTPLMPLLCLAAAAGIERWISARLSLSSQNPSRGTLS